MSKHHLQRLSRLYDLFFHENFKTSDGLRRQTESRYSEEKELSFYGNAEEWRFLDGENSILENINQGHRKNVLVIGCGAGREFSKLFNQELYGVDTAESLLVLCRRHFPLSKVAQKLDDLEKKKFDVIYISHHVYNHIQGRQNRIAFLKSLQERLQSQGQIYLTLDIFSFSFFKHCKFYFSSMILKVRWMKNKIHWEKGDTVRAYNGAHNPLGRIFFYHYFFTECDVEDELKKVGLRLKRKNNFWVLG